MDIITIAKRFIDSIAQPVKIMNMDDSDFTSPRKDDAMAHIANQDLGPLSIDELNARIDALKAEIARCETHRDQASNHRRAAEALFGKKS